MSIQDCLNIKFTPEEEKSIEKEARELATNHCGEHVAEVCVTLLKQSRYQSKLLEHARNQVRCLELEVTQLRGHL